MKNIDNYNTKVISNISTFLKLRKIFIFLYQIEKLQDNILKFNNENDLLQQKIEKLEKQINILHTQNQSLEYDQQSYQEKVNYLILY